jgi:cold-inducible RNA-binding protein
VRQAGKEEIEMKLYVGNLPYNAREDELRELFAQHGSVATVTVVVDNQTGRSRGFGFVEMEDSEQGEKAIAAVNGIELGGRALVVNQARPRGTDRPERRGRQGGYGGGGGDRSDRGGGRGFGGGRRGY